MPLSAPVVAPPDPSAGPPAGPPSGPGGGPRPDPNEWLLYSVYAAWERRDLQRLLGLFVPEPEIRQSALLPWGGHYLGREAAIRFLTTLSRHVDSRFVLERVISADDHAVAVGRSCGTVRATGARFDVAAVHVYSVRGGRLASMEAHLDTPAMLAALGR